MTLITKPAIPTYKRLLIAWFFVPFHRLLFRLSNGRLLGELEGHGVLILVTRGRKSGKPRSSPLMYFKFEGSDDLIIVASNYGQDHHPAWYLNVTADPNVTVEIQRRDLRGHGPYHPKRGTHRPLRQSCRIKPSLRPLPSRHPPPNTQSSALRRAVPPDQVLK